MTIAFYDHPGTGRLHFRAGAGGVGSGQTGIFDAPATQQQVEGHPVEYKEYLRLKTEGRGENDLNITNEMSRELYVRRIEDELAKARATIERQHREIALLRDKA